MFRRRPKKAFFVYIHVFTSATMPPTGGQYAKRIRIRSTTHLPIIDRPEIPAVIYDFPQSLPFILAWQVPAIRTDSMHRIFHRTGHHKTLAHTIRIQKTGTIDRSAPQVQASVFFTILDRIVVAETARIQGFRRLQIVLDEDDLTLFELEDSELSPPPTRKSPSSSLQAVNKNVIAKKAATRDKCFKRHSSKKTHLKYT